MKIIQHDQRVIARKNPLYSDSLHAYDAVDVHAALKRKDLIVSATDFSVRDSNSSINAVNSELDFPQWLPFAAKSYNISPDPKDYILQPYIIMLSDLPNRNAVGFPLTELIKWNREIARQAYQGWRGQPAFYEHCARSGTLIRIENNLAKPIEKIQIGDLVLTHLNRYRPVLQVFSNGKKKVNKIHCNLKAGPLEFTINHPFWVIDKRQMYKDTLNDLDWNLASNEAMEQWLSPHFRPLSDVYEGDYLIVPIGAKDSLEDKQDILKFKDYYLTPIKAIEYDTSIENVFNLEVEEDNSYVADGIIVHNCNEDHTKALGVIVDVALRKLEGYSNDNLWKVIILMGLDRTSRPDLAKRVLNQDLRSVSMGSYVEGYTCSKCGAELGYCSHLNPNQSFDFYTDADKDLIYRLVRSITPFETSFVEIPAYSLAVSDIVHTL